MRSKTERPPNALLSKREAAEYIGVTTRTLDNYMAKRLVPFYRIGEKTIRFRGTDLDAAMEKFRVAA
jgi:excisionase family DNA binding protein